MSGSAIGLCKKIVLLHSPKATTKKTCCIRMFPSTAFV